MGSRQLLITSLIICHLLYNAHETFAKPNELHEERREYQYQRSSKVFSGGPGYYNTNSGNYDNSNLDEWMSRNREQVQGMAEKLRSELDTTQVKRASIGNSAYVSDCNARCAMLPLFTGKSQEEIDVIAKDMTRQIIADMQSGKLDKNQLNQPNWFEHRVAQKLEELNKQHQDQYQQNVYAAANRFRQTHGQDVYTQPGTYQRDNNADDLQQSQQNIFSADDLSQVQQTISNQRQFQQQGSFFQEQSQNQHSIYTRPVTRYQFTQSTNQEEGQNIRPPGRTYIATNVNTDQHAEERSRTVYPTPVVVTANTREERNYTSSGTSTRPQMPTYNQYGHTEIENTEEDVGQVTQPMGHTFVNTDNTDSEFVRETRPIVRPTQPSTYGGSTYQSRNQYEESHRTSYSSPPPPPPPRTTQETRTYHTTIEERQSTIPIQIPTERTQITTNIDEETRNHVFTTPDIYTGGYNTEKDINLETYIRDRTNRVRPTVPSTYTTNVREDERRTTVVEVHTPQPIVVTTGSKHSIYNHLAESEVVPNYRPRVVIDKNTEFQVLDHKHEDEYQRTPQQVLVQRQNEEYRDRVQRLQNDLTHWGLPSFTQSEYNSTISTGSFVRNGFKYIYNVDNGHFEQSERIETEENIARQPQRNQTITYETTDDRQTHVTAPRRYVFELTDEEYEERLQQIKQELARLGYTRITQEMYNATIESGGFTHNGYKYLYNPNTGRYYQSNRVEETSQTGNTRPEYPTETYDHRYIEGENVQTHSQTIQPLRRRVYERITDEQYTERLEQLQNALSRLGYGRFTNDAYNQTISYGGFMHDGYKYVYNTGTRRFEKNGRIEEVTEEEKYENINRELQHKLQEIGFNRMTEQEINQTLTTGIFIRGGCKYTYNTETEQYDKFEITADEKQKIFYRIQEILKRLGFRQISQRENEALLQEGHMIRGGYRWLYNSQSGSLEKSDFVGEFAELSTDEYNAIYRRIQETLRRLGYSQMSGAQCNATITSGTFERGGIFWTWNGDSGQFERVELSQNEYRDRLNLVRNELARIGHRHLSPEEYRAIVYKGFFHHGGYRYEYNSRTGRFEQVEISDEEYTERLRRLQAQLKQIGYGTMTETDCNTTISNGVFYYRGHEWLYNFDSGIYDMGERVDNGLDQTRYGSSMNKENKDNKTDNKDNKEGANKTPSGRRRYGEISKNRGDQPPQHFNEDYESEEILEQEPGLGFYAADVKPEIGLAPPDSFSHVREPNTTPVPRPQPTPPRATVSSYQSEMDRRKYEAERTVEQPVPVAQRNEYERRYHRMETSYVQSGMPILYATQRTLPTEFNEQTTDFDVTTPTLAYATEVYTVGSDIERPRRPQTTAANQRRRSPDINIEDQILPRDAKHHKLEDLGQVYIDDKKHDKLEDLGQVYVDDSQKVQPIDDSQKTEDLTQQLVGMNSQMSQSESERRRQEAEDLRELQRAYGLGNNQQTDDLGQRHETEDLRQHHETEDLRQHQETEDLRQHHETEDLRQHHQTEDLRQHHETENLRQRHEFADVQHHETEDLDQHRQAGDLRHHQDTEELRQLQVSQNLQQRQATEDLRHDNLIQQSHRMTYSQNEPKSIPQRNADSVEEVARVAEVTITEKPEEQGLWTRLKEKTKNLFG